LVGVCVGDLTSGEFVKKAITLKLEFCLELLIPFLKVAWKIFIFLVCGVTDFSSFCFCSCNAAVFWFHSACILRLDFSGEFKRTSENIFLSSLSPFRLKSPPLSTLQNERGNQKSCFVELSDT
jgi:hypothetical protein